MFDWLANAGAVAGIVTVIGAVGGMVVSIINAVRGNQIRTAVNETQRTTQETKEKMDQNEHTIGAIHEKTAQALANTDGNLTRLQEALARSETKNAALEKALEAVTTVMLRTHQAAAPVITSVTTPPSPASPQTPVIGDRATDLIDATAQRKKTDDEKKDK